MTHRQHTFERAEELSETTAAQVVSAQAVQAAAHCTPYACSLRVLENGVGGTDLHLHAPSSHDFRERFVNPQAR